MNVYVQVDQIPPKPPKCINEMIKIVLISHKCCCHIWTDKKQKEGNIWALLRRPLKQNDM